MSGPRQLVLGVKTYTRTTLKDSSMVVMSEPTGCLVVAVGDGYTAKAHILSPQEVALLRAFLSAGDQ